MIWARKAPPAFVVSLACAVGALVVLFASLGGRGAAPSAPSPPVGTAPPAGRFIVQLSRPALVEYTGADPRFAPPPRGPRGKIDFTHPATRAYLKRLELDQDGLLAAVRRFLPHLRVDHRYRVLLNGLAIHLPRKARARVAALPGVRRIWATDRAWYRPTMDASLPLIGAPDYWDDLGGQPYAGYGIKVAVIDTGIDPDNPFFDATGFSPPFGFPKGATSYTTGKIIAARVYLRSDDPVDTSRDEPNPIDHLGHGSHVAGTIAGNAGTVFDVGGYDAPVSGVAPRAQLMNYKVFYRAESGTEGAREPELMKAFEDAVVDGADVINNSWGGPDVFGDADPSMVVYANAIEAGAVVVFAAGNEGPGDGSIGSPGGHGRFITVGASGVGRYFDRYIDVTGPATVPGHLVGLPMVIGRISASFGGNDVGPAPVRSSHLVDGGANELGCDPWSPGAFDGAIALVLRGDCTFSLKQQHAADASAVALVVMNHTPSEGAFSMGGDRGAIPAVMVSTATGNLLRDWIDQHPTTAEIAIFIGLIPFGESTSLDQVVGFSSRGPTAFGGLKPDLVAPGDPILSADAHRVGSNSTRPWGLKSGTSMATPHVSGAAALLLQSHQTWTHDDVRAALIGTATRVGLGSSIGGMARAWEAGGGRLDLRALRDVRVLAAPPSLELGESTAPATLAGRLALRPVADVAQVTLAWDPQTAPSGVVFHPPSGTTFGLASGATLEIDVTVEVPASFPAQDVSGFLLLDDDGGGRTVVPYLWRVTAPRGEKDLLIVDMAYGADNQTYDYPQLYVGLAEELGLTYDRASQEQLWNAPPLPELLRYRAVLVSTGDDTWHFFTTAGRGTLDHLSHYLARGGRVIVAGQGPLRDSPHERFTALLGMGTDEGLPLYDEASDSVVTLSEWSVVAIARPELSSVPLNIAPPGLGNRGRIGELLGVQISEDAAPWSREILRMTQGNFRGAGAVGMVYDPFVAYGEDPLAEAHSHRAVFLGFGLEVINDPSDASDMVPAPGSRAEVLWNAYQWVTEDVTLSLSVQRVDTWVELTANAVSRNGAIDSYRFDFGDGSARQEGRQDSATHLYPRFGAYPVEVIAKSSLGGAAIVRRTVLVQPGSEGLADAGATDASDATLIEGARRGCNCRTVPEWGDLFSASPIWLLLLLFWVWRRRRSGAA